MPPQKASCQGAVRGAQVLSGGKEAGQAMQSGGGYCGFAMFCFHNYFFAYIYIYIFCFLLSPKCIFKAEVVSTVSVSSNHLPEVWKTMQKLQSLCRGTKGKRGDRTEHYEYCECAHSRKNALHKNIFYGQAQVVLIESFHYKTHLTNNYRVAKGSFLCILSLHLWM